MSAICMPRLRPAGRAARKRERKKGRGGKREKESEREIRRGDRHSVALQLVVQSRKPADKMENPKKQRGRGTKAAQRGGHERARHVHQASHTVASTASLLSLPHPLFVSPSLYHSIFDQSMQFCINCRINYTD